MKPEAFGWYLWTLLHVLAYHFPEAPTSAQQKQAADVFNSLRHLLPCSECQSHYTGELATSPVEPHTKSRQSLFEWVWALHNRVNVRLGKHEMSLKDCTDKYLIMHYAKYEHERRQPQRAYWGTLLAVALEYPVEAPPSAVQQAARTFFPAVTQLLSHADHNLAARIMHHVQGKPWPLSGRDVLIQAVTQLHDSVAAGDGYRSFSFAEMRAAMEEAQCDDCSLEAALRAGSGGGHKPRGGIAALLQRASEGDSAAMNKVMAAGAGAVLVLLLIFTLLWLRKKRRS